MYSCFAASTGSLFLILGNAQDTGGQESMAREVDLKRVELKVSVHCCEGCKRKVKKVLQSIEGVLKTEIDPTQPKVTVVLGNIDPQILVKKLMRAGKQVEIWPCNSKKENPNNPAAAGKGKEYGEAAGSFINGKQKGTDDGIGDGCHGGGEKKSVSEWDQDHQGGGCTVHKQRKESSTSGGSANTYTYTNTKTKTKGEGCCKQGVIETKNSNSNHGANGPPPPPPPTPTATLYPSLVHNAGNGNITSSATSANNGSTRTHCCMVEPRAIPPPLAPYYMMTLMGSHSNSSNYALPHQFNYAPPDHFLHLPPPPVPVSMPMVGDYFSDENTVGCHVM